jgi:hypothetical protein
MVATSGPGWQLAPCLAALVKETDRLFPHRSTASDGSIGDQAHASRASDHNPASGWVCAVDITDDKAHRCDADLLAQHLVASRDPRVKYVIWNGTIVKSYRDSKGVTAWQPQPYTGINAHEKHTHISVHNDPISRANTGPWWPQEDDMSEALDKLNAIELRIIALEKRVSEVADRQVPEETVRADIRLTRAIAETVGVPEDQIPKS